MGQDETDFFNIDAGVRQGCVLYPILFSIFINKMAKDINEIDIGIKVKDRKIAVLLYADDIVIITDKAEDLKKGLKIATNFGKKWRCKYNTKKTQVVIFGKNRKDKHDWEIGSRKIEQVESYKYLGIDIEVKLKWRLFKERLLEKANRNMRAAMGMGSRTKHLSVKAAVGLWEALVLPILEYAAEIWGESNWKEADILQRTVAKRILGMKERTANEAVLGDLGWWPLKARRDMIRLRYWRNLLKMKNTRLPKLIYEWEKDSVVNDSSWITYTIKLLRELNLDEYWNKQEINKTKDEWNKLIYNKIQEREQKEWRERSQLKPKLRTYIKYKTILKEEDYLKNEDAIGRRMMARIRSGTHNLRIETGRYERPRQIEEFRICEICFREAESEEHFLKRCIAYDDIRKDFLTELNKEEDDETIGNILFGVGKEKEINKAIRYIRRAMAKRKRILDMTRR